MFYIEVAKLLIQINNYYDKIKQKCKDYLCEPYREPDLVIEADEQLIAYGLKLFWEREHIEATKGDAEASLAPHNIYGQLPLFGALWLHAVLLEMDGEGYMVTAPSGYGKTTQARLWLKAFPDRARIINGDNPIVRKDGDGFVAYGTPFCGKEGYQVNTCVPLKGLCYLKHGETTPFSVWIRRWPSPSCCGSISIGSRQKIRKNIWKCCSSLWRLSLSISLPAIWTARRPLWLMKE